MLSRNQRVQLYATVKSEWLCLQRWNNLWHVALKGGWHGWKRMVRKMVRTRGYNLDISLVPRNQQVQPYATHLSANVTLSWEVEECSAYGQMTGKGWFACIPPAHTPLPSPQILPQSAVPAAE